MKWGGTAPWCPCVHLVFANGNDVRVYLHKEQGETHVDMHANARCELTCLELSTCDRITREAC